jgi:hypothetical protein
MIEYVAPANAFLKFERGPTTDVHLQWGSYYDAADQSGIRPSAASIPASIDFTDGRSAGRSASARGRPQHVLRRYGV